LASSLVGLLVDSILFLWLAYGSLEFLAGQIVGKTLMVVASMPFVMWLNSRDQRLGVAPAHHQARAVNIPSYGADTGERTELRKPP
jgi:hypothetical protein